MTDLEMTRLCAEAMRLEISLTSDGSCYYCDELLTGYDPLHDDAQAMALVKKFFLRTEWLITKDWVALYGGNNAPNDKCVVSSSADLNRAIVECVAEMQQAKK